MKYYPVEQEELDLFAPPPALPAPAPVPDPAPALIPRGPLGWPPAGVRPYYHDATTCIIHGDCREILPVLFDIDLVVTDPPYGVDYDGGSLVREKLAGDTSPLLYAEAIRMCRRAARDSAAFYIFYADSQTLAVRQAVDAAGLGVRNNLIWVKNMAQFGNPFAQYKQKFEPLLYCHIKGHSPKWRGPANEVNVWEADRASANKLHPTQKPLDLMLRCIRNSSDPGDTVLDPFAGSGTSLRAAKDLGRRSIGIEIEEAYCEVAAGRMVQEVLALSA